MARALRWTIWIGVPLAVAIVAYRNGDAILAALDLIGQARWPWLALGLGFIAMLYICRALVYGIPLALLGFVFPRRFLWESALVSTALHQLLPSGGLSGYAFLTWALHRRGVPRGQAPLIALIDTLSYVVAAAALVLASVAYLTITGAALTPAVLLGFAPGIALLAAGAWVYVLQRSETRFVRHALRVQRALAAALGGRWSEAALRAGIDEYYRGKAIIRHYSGRFVTMVLLQSAAVGCEAATLYCVFAALDVFPGSGTIVLGYMLALAAGTVVSAPAGGGSFEVVLAAFFTSHGVTEAHAVAGALVFRLGSFWIPLALSAALLPRFRRYRHEIRRASTHAEAA